MTCWKITKDASGENKGEIQTLRDEATNRMKSFDEIGPQLLNHERTY